MSTPAPTGAVLAASNPGSRSLPPLSRVAGPLALVGGTLFAIVHVGQLAVMDRTDLVAMMRDPVFQVFNAGYAVTFPLLLIALFALYERQAREAGVLGAVGFCAATVGTVALGGDMWFEGFAVPWLAQVAPQVFTADKSGSILLIGALTSFLLFAAGWFLFGLASLRAKVFPAYLSTGVMAGGLVGFMAAQPPYAFPLGVAVALQGGWLIRSNRAAGRRRLAQGGAPGPAS